MIDLISRGRHGAFWAVAAGECVASHERSVSTTATGAERQRPMLLVAAASSLALSSAMLLAPCPQQACARRRPPHHHHPLPLPGRRRRRRHPHHPCHLRSPRCKHEPAALASLPRPRAHAALPRPCPYRVPPGEPKAMVHGIGGGPLRSRGSGGARTGRPLCLGVRGCPEPSGAPCGGAAAQLAQCQGGVSTCCASTAAQACDRCCGCARAHAAAAANAPHATTCAWLSAELRQRLTSAVQPCRATAASTGPCNCSASTNASKRLEWASALE